MACLKLYVSDPIVANLTEAVRLRGMRQFISHEPIARGVFNRGFTSGRDKFESWNVQLTNGDDDVLVSWLVVCSSVLALIAFLQSAVPAHSLGQFVLGTNHGRLRQIPSLLQEGARLQGCLLAACARGRLHSFQRSDGKGGAEHGLPNHGAANEGAVLGRRPRPRNRARLDSHCPSWRPQIPVNV